MQDSSQLCVSPLTSASAIVQEAYYSSALDGAVEITSRTQQAILFALQRLQVPIDAKHVYELVSLLTGAVVAYRATTTPGAPVPASIPRHLEHLYRFLDDKRYHPLIKAAASHAFILAVQPFTIDAGGHGVNGRLARLISMMILLRSGYSFLLNSSHSAVIVERSAEYVQSFQSIFFANNAYGQAGNVTGFVEYIIETLVMTQRRVLQVNPVSVGNSVSGNKPSSEHIVSSGNKPSSGNTISSGNMPVSDCSRTATDKTGSATEILQSSADVLRPDIPSASPDHKPAANVPSTDTSTVPSTDTAPVPYTDTATVPYTDTATVFKAAPAREDEILNIPAFEARLSKLDRSAAPLVRRTADVVRELLNDQQFEFTVQTWRERTGMTQKQFDAVRDTLRRNNLVYVAGKWTNKAVYRFRLNPDSEDIASDGEDDQRERLIEYSDVKMSTQMEAMESEDAIIANPVMASDVVMHPNMNMLSDVSTSSDAFKLPNSNDKKESVEQPEESTPPFISTLPSLSTLPSPSTQTSPSTQPRPVEMDTTADFPDLPILREMETSRFESVRKTAAFYSCLLKDNITEITREEWMQRAGLSSREFHKSYAILIKRHLISNLYQGNRHYSVYKITPECTAFLSPTVFWSRLESLENSKSDRVRIGAATVREMIEEGLHGFTSLEWANRTGMQIIDFCTIKNRLIENQLITNANKSSDVRGAFYRFTLEGQTDSHTTNSLGYADGNDAIDSIAGESLGEGETGVTEVTEAIEEALVADAAEAVEVTDTAEVTEAIEVTDTAEVTEAIEVTDVERQKQSFIRHLNDMTFNRSEVVRRGAEIIRTMIAEGTMTFTSKDWKRRTNDYCNCYSAMASRGLIRRLPQKKRKIAIYAYNWPAGAELPEAQAPTIQKHMIDSERYSSILNQLAAIVPIDNFSEKAMAAMGDDPNHTTEFDWATVNNLSVDEAVHDMNVLCCMGIVTRRYYKKSAAFGYHFREPEVLLRMLQNGELAAPQQSDNLFFWGNVAIMSRMKSPLTKKAAEVIRDMADAEQFYFTSGSWIRRTGMNNTQFRDCLAVMTAQHVVTLVDDSEYRLIFRLNIAPVGTPIDFCELIGIENTISDAQLERIRRFSLNATCEMDTRIASFLQARIEKGICFFTRKEYARTYPHSNNAKVKDIYRACSLGLIGRTHALGTIVYILSPFIGDESGSGRELPFPNDAKSTRPRKTNNPRKRKYPQSLTNLQKRRLTLILHTYGYNEFSRIDYERAFQLKEGRYSLDSAVAAGLLIKRKSWDMNYYRLAVTPKERPECFEMTPAEHK